MKRPENILKLRKGKTKYKVSIKINLLIQLVMTLLLVAFTFYILK